MNIRSDIKLIPVTDLREAGTNAKKHTDEQVDILARGIERFGFNVPLVITTDNEIIAGHGRLYAAKKLGIHEVPCIIADNLTPEEIEAYRLADNQINAMTGFDMPMVVEGLKYLDSTGFDISLTGFSPDLLIEKQEEEKEISLKDKFEIVITAENEEDQERIYNELSEHYNCRILSY